MKQLFKKYERDLGLGIDIPSGYIFNPAWGNVPPYDILEYYFTDNFKYPRDAY